MAESEFLNIRAIGVDLRVKHYPAATYLEQVGSGARFIPHAVQASTFDGQAWDLSALAALAQRQLGALIPLDLVPVVLSWSSILRVCRWRDLIPGQVYTHLAWKRRATARGCEDQHMEEVSSLYIRVSGSVYRVKVFAQSVWVERQPGGDNLPFARADHPVFDGQTWDLAALSILIGSYHSEVLSR